MYSNIVKDDDDIIGLVAYALYKKHKIEFFKEIRKSNGDKEPSVDEITTFIKGASTESQINSYRDQAGRILMDVVANVTEEQIKQASDEMLQNYEAKISEAVKKETPSDWKTIGLNVVGTFLFSAIVTAILFLGNFSERFTKNVVDGVVEKFSMEKPAQTLSDTTDTVTPSHP